MWDLIQDGIIHVSRSEGGNCAVAGGLTGPSLRSRQAGRTEARTKSFLLTPCGEIEKQRAPIYWGRSWRLETKWRSGMGPIFTWAEFEWGLSISVVLLGKLKAFVNKSVEIAFALAACLAGFAWNVMLTHLPLTLLLLLFKHYPDKSDFIFSASLIFVTLCFFFEWLNHCNFPSNPGPFVSSFHNHTSHKRKTLGVIVISCYSCIQPLNANRLHQFKWFNGWM